MKWNTIILRQCLSEFRFECVWMCECLCSFVLLANLLSFFNSYLTHTHIPICFYRTFNPLKYICNIWFYIWFFGSLFWIWMYTVLAIHWTRNWKMHAQTPAFEWKFSNPHPQIYWMECWSIISVERPKICKSNGIQKLLCLINRNLLTFTCLTLFDLILESSISLEHFMLDVFLICSWTLITMRKLFAVVLLFINRFFPFSIHTAPQNFPCLSFSLSSHANHKNILKFLARFYLLKMFGNVCQFFSIQLNG